MIHCFIVTGLHCTTHFSNTDIFVIFNNFFVKFMLRKKKQDTKWKDITLMHVLLAKHPKKFLFLLLLLNGLSFSTEKWFLCANSIGGTYCQLRSKASVFWADKQKLVLFSWHLSSVFLLCTFHSSTNASKKHEKEKGVILCWFTNFKPRNNICRRFRGHQSEVCWEFLQVHESNDSS